MTIARRRGLTIDNVAAPTAMPPSRPTPVPGRAFPIPMGDAPAPDAITPVGRLRRCTFRRIDVVSSPDRSQPPAYEVVCLYAGRDAPIALGDIAQARPVCEACTAPGIFRPDED